MDANPPQASLCHCSRACRPSGLCHSTCPQEHNSVSCAHWLIVSPPAPPTLPEPELQGRPCLGLDWANGQSSTIQQPGLGSTTCQPRPGTHRLGNKLHLGLSHPLATGVPPVGALLQHVPDGHTHTIQQHGLVSIKASPTPKPQGLNHTWGWVATWPPGCRPLGLCCRMAWSAAMPAPPQDPEG